MNKKLVENEEWPYSQKCDKILRVLWYVNIRMAYEQTRKGKKLRLPDKLSGKLNSGFSPSLIR